MKVLSIVTLISKLGEYGGPVRVALNQATALRERGHQVIVAAATRGFDTPPTEMDGIPLRLFKAHQLLPRTGFAGMVAPDLLSWIWRYAREADVVHIHAARDLVTLPAAQFIKASRTPYFLQTHGMIDASQHPLSKPLDAILTRPVLRGASKVFHLTELERSQLVEVAGAGLPLVSLPNGVPPADPAPMDQDAAPEVLFLARLAPRKRPMLMVEAARALHAKHPRARFALVGPDEGEGQAVAAAIKKANAEGVPVAWEGALSPEHTLDRLKASTVYVLPSINEPYPMSVLEAMSIAKPVVLTDTCGLSTIVQEQDAGIVVDDSLAGLIRAVDLLLSDPEEAAAKGRRGRNYVRTHLSMAAIGAELERHYQEAVDAPR